LRHGFQKTVVRHGRFAIEHHRQRQQHAAGHHEGDHVRHAGHKMPLGIF